MNEFIINLLKNRNPKLCTIATIGPNNKPQNTLVGYAINDNFQIFINTNLNTRKWANIKSNNNVALVFGWGFDEMNIQYEGTAELLENTHPDYKNSETFFFTQNPDAQKFKSEDTRIIRITPKWIRVMDPTIMPPLVKELQI